MAKKFKIVQSIDAPKLEEQLNHASEVLKDFKIEGFNHFLLNREELAFAALISYDEE